MAASMMSKLRDMPTTVIGVQCRLSSSRLPGKALLSLCNSTVLGLCLDRAKESGFPVYLLTSTELIDDLIVDQAGMHAVDGVIRGSLDNVLSRYVSLIKSTSAEYIVRVTADNPLTDFSFISPLVNHLEVTNQNYAWINPELCPEGTNLEVIRASSLIRSMDLDTSSSNLEHVTPFIRAEMAEFNYCQEIASCAYPFSCIDQSFTVDTLHDYFKVSKIVNAVISEFNMSPFHPLFVKKCSEYLKSNCSSGFLGRRHVIQRL